GFTPPSQNQKQVADADPASAQRLRLLFIDPSQDQAIFQRIQPRGQPLPDRPGLTFVQHAIKEGFLVAAGQRPQLAQCPATAPGVPNVVAQQYTAHGGSSAQER